MNNIINEKLITENNLEEHVKKHEKTYLIILCIIGTLNNLTWFLLLQLLMK